MSKDHVKNVNVKQCFGTIFMSLIAACVALIPVTFGSVGINFLYESLPLVGDETFLLLSESMLPGFAKVTKLGTDVIDILAIVMEYAPYAYFGILAANILFSLLLIITRSQILRAIFKVITIFAGIAMLVVALNYLVYIIGFAGYFIQGEVPVEQIMAKLEVSGLLPALGLFIMGLSMTGKQFRYFAKLY
ncbi:MAG: hypothetical protein E7347_03325 [Clostridiales bacterium]|nr:hypothetical protein [Clostridiales bacterium]